MLGFSNSIQEATKRLQDNNIASHHYTADRAKFIESLEHFKCMVDKQLQEPEVYGDLYDASSRVSNTRNEMLWYAGNTIFIGEVFSPFLSYLQHYTEEIYHHIEQKFDGSDIHHENYPFELRQSLVRYIFFIFAKFTFEKSKDFESGVQEWKFNFGWPTWGFSSYFIQAASQILPQFQQKEIPSSLQARLKEAMFITAAAEYLSDNPGVFIEKWADLNLWWSVATADISLDPLFTADLVSSYQEFSQNNFSEVRDSLMLNILDNTTTWMLVPYSVVWSVAQYFSQQSEFSDLSISDRKSMFFSLRTEMIYEALHWNKPFLNVPDRNINSSVHFTPSVGVPHKEIYVFNFHEKKIFMDGEKQHQCPQTHTAARKTCPAMHATSKDSKWNLATYHLDMALNLYWDNYLSKL